MSISIDGISIDSISDDCISNDGNSVDGVSEEVKISGLLTLCLNGGQKLADATSASHSRVSRV